jgi:hypothetical protein
MMKAILAIALGSTLVFAFAALRSQGRSNAAEDLALAADATETPAAAPERISKGPVVSNVTPHSASIGWITEDEAPTEVRYSSDGKRWHTAVKPGAERGHVVNITRLAPNTGYQFMIMSAGHAASFTGAFHTKPQ